MSDSPQGPESPFDSLSSRLGKALKRSDAGHSDPAAEAPPPSDEPAIADGPSPYDSFADRLGKSLEEPSGDAQNHRPTARTDEAPTDAAPPASHGPVGSGEHVVSEGDCISSIANDSGHFWETIWDDGQNSELRSARKDPNVLLPLDRVHVPPLREKWEPRQTEARHRFRRRGWPEVLRVRMLRDGEPRGNEPYVLAVDGREFTGVTDANGNISCPIAPNARHAVLHLGVEPDVYRYDLMLGAIDPIDAISGVQGRLSNLGFDCGEIDGICGPRTEAALRKYQKSRDIAVTGQPDGVTRQRLQKDYGC